MSEDVCDQNQLPEYFDAFHPVPYEIRKPNVSELQDAISSSPFLFADLQWALGDGWDTMSDARDITIHHGQLSLSGNSWEVNGNDVNWGIRDDPDEFGLTFHMSGGLPKDRWAFVCAENGVKWLRRVLLEQPVEITIDAKAVVDLMSGRTKSSGAHPLPKKVPNNDEGANG